MIETLLRRPSKGLVGLDAMIACYLTLAGEEGLPLIDELFISAPKIDYSKTYAAIMALRFHGNEGDVIPLSALVESFHKVLDNDELADLVIPDLARWKDWSQIDRLTRLFEDANDDNNWIRVPVVNYMRACPLPEAQTAIDKLEKIDPEAVRRSKTFFPLPVPVREKPSEDTTSQSRAIPGTAKSGTRYAAITPRSNPRSIADNTMDRVGGLPSQMMAAGPGIVAVSANPWDLGYVITIALASLVLILFLLLTGGPATGAISTVGLDD